MPLFLSEEEYARCSHDPSLIAQKADAFIRELYNQLETEKAQYDASSITAEQTCSLLEQKYVSLKSEFTTLQSQHLQLNSTLEERVSELAQIQSDKHQIYLQSIVKDGEIERVLLEASELQKSKGQLLQLIEHKDSEINEKNASIKGYLDKIYSLTDSSSSKETRISELEAELARVHTSLARLSQEKELVERHNVWLNDELTTKINSFLELRKVHNELEADMSSKLADLEKKYNDTSSSLKWKDDRVKELESKLEALQEELCSSKDMAAATEERLSAELSTVNKLVELYKENSDEWSKKAGELEGVIKALETHASQVEKDYNEKLEKETSARIESEKEVSRLKDKVEKCEAELENFRNSDQLNLLQMSSFNSKAYEDPIDVNSLDGDNLMLVPSIPAGISGTALAASLLRDGWSLVKMYEKYQEAVDALRHEQLGRKQSQSILERVLHEIEEKAEVILDERAEHDRMVDAYDVLNEKLQHSLSEQTSLERTIQELKAELRRHERDYKLAQKENTDLQKQVTILLKECRDIQLRCGSVNHDYAIEVLSSPADQLNISSDSDTVLSERLLTFKDINGLVEQNVQLRSLVRLLTEQIETKEVELKENFEKEFQKHSNETASKVDAVLARAEEQALMIESLHTSVAMYKKLYEEEHKRHLSRLQSPETAPAARKNDAVLLLESSHDVSQRAQEQAYERIKQLEEEITGLRGEIITLRSQRDKLSLEATFSHEKLDRFIKDFEHQREETNGIISRNVEFSQLIVDYQRKIREASEDLHTAGYLSRKLSMEVSILKREKEILSNSEKRALEEVRNLSERVHELQATLNTIQSAEEVREETRIAQRMSQEDYVKRTEREWAEAKKELQEERDNVRKLTLEHDTAMRGAMQRIEEMGKELANALRAVADANTRASAAEERCSHLEKMKLSGMRTSEINDELAPTSSIKDDMAGLHAAKEEIEKLRVEAQINKDHMLQYKSIAQVNEAALKQMEASHENFKVEAEKVKKSLEDELISLKEQVNQLQDGYNLKAKEAASAAVSQEEALAASLSEISSLREECTAKMLRVEALESQMSAMKDDLEKEHQRWRTAQDNYERQVILQSETIQELTKTSQALALLQEEASELRRVSDILKLENEELRNKWETEKLVLEEAKDRAEKKYNEMNEQNKILHDQLEALHIKMAEKSHGSVAQSSGSVGGSDDAGLQNVVKYLRRSKEIAETEISLLKQEKLRLQSQLEGALKAEETAQGLLRAERENSRSVHFTEEEFKALQLQVREMNLLRESNVQLREENRHNFEECQRLRQSIHDARVEVEKLERLVGERQNEVEACKREIEMQKNDRKDLEKRVGELLDRFKDIDPEDHGRMRADFQQMQVKLLDKDGHLEEIKKVVSEKQEVILRLEQDLAKSKVEIDEREGRISSIVQTETSLKSDVDRQKRFILQLKRRCESLVKEKEELSKKNQELSKELIDSNQVKKSNVDPSVGEQATREREEKDTRIQMLERTVEKLREESREREEKDARIQMLEKVVERLRDEVRKGKDEVRIEKAKNQKTEKGIGESQEKLKLADDFEKHKQALKTLSDEVEKLKHATESEGASGAPTHFGDSVDDVAAACLLAVENFEQVTHQVSSEFGLPTTADTLPVEVAAPGRAAAGEVASTTVGSVVPAAQNIEGSAKASVTSMPKVEPRKVARRLVRPRIVKPEQPKRDVDMLETVGANTQSSIRKRPSALSASEGQEGSHVHESNASDVAAPVIKKSRGSEQPQEGTEVQSSVVTSDAFESSTSLAEGSLGNIGDETQNLKEETVDTGRDEEVETGEEQAGDDQAELQIDRNYNDEENINRPAETDVSEDQTKITEAEHTQMQQATAEAGSDPEEGEFVSDAVPVHEGDGANAGNNASGAMVVNNQEMMEGQSTEHHIRSPSPLPVEDEAAEDTLGDMEISSPLLTLEDNEEKNEEGEIEAEETTPESSTDKLNNDGNDEAVSMAEEAATDNVSATAPVATQPVAEKTSNTSTAEASAVNQEGSTLSSVSTSGPAEVKPDEPVADTTSTTINLNERARQRSLQRLAGAQPSPPVTTRGRGRAPRGRVRGGRTARGGQTPGPQVLAPVADLHDLSIVRLGEEICKVKCYDKAKGSDVSKSKSCAAAHKRNLLLNVGSTIEDGVQVTNIKLKFCLIGWSFAISKWPACIPISSQVRLRVFFFGYAKYVAALLVLHEVWGPSILKELHV